MVNYFQNRFVNEYPSQFARVNNVSFYRSSINAGENATGICIEGSVNGRGFRHCHSYSDTYLYGDECLSSEHYGLLSGESANIVYSQMIDCLEQDGILGDD